METLKTVFCTICDKDQDFDVQTDHNGESVLTCTTCGHFVKFPELSDMDKSINAYDEANQ